MGGALNPLLGFAAGCLTILSPCVLPLVPIVLGSAAQTNRRGPLALAAGLVLSFSVTGFMLARLGAVAGLDGDTLRVAGAILLGLAGLFLSVSWLQDRLTMVAAPLASWAHRRQAGLERRGLSGQFAIGALLGLVWSPCVGPTLGAATVLAARGENLLAVALTMCAFGLGIATVLLAIAYAARAAFTRRRAGLLTAGKVGKRALGGILMFTSALILTRSDHLFESLVLMHLPPALADISVSI